jgi:hypothetical protein
MKSLTTKHPIVYFKTTALILIAAVFFPFFVHLIPPMDGIPIGAFLLPMFYIPFIAIFFYDWKIALPIALLAPLLNFLITGNPNWEFLAVLTIELILFTGIVYMLLSKGKIKWFAAPLGYIIAKIISSLLLFLIPLLPAVPWEFFLTSLSRALPGIGILWLINFLLLKFFSPEHRHDAQA